MSKAGRKARQAKQLPPVAAFEHAVRVAAIQSRLDIITPEQRAKGTYDGERRIVNTGGTPVMRWIKAGKINETQALAIQLCYRLWDLAGIRQRTTANYGEQIGGEGDPVEWRAVTEIEARENLHRVQDYFPGALKGYWSVFENVCRHDEPAGVAGSRLGFGARSAEDRAHTIVCFVADVIAMNERLIPNVRMMAC